MRRSRPTTFADMYGARAMSVAAAVWLTACAQATPSGDDDEGGGPDAAAPAPDASGSIDAPASPLDAAGPTIDGAPAPADAAPAGSIDAGPPLGVCESAALMPDNDACPAALDITASAIGPSGTTIYGDITTYVNHVEPPSSCTSGFGQDGPDAIYRVDATAGQTISVTMTPLAYDGSLYILTSCTTPTSCTTGADLGLDGAAEVITHTAATTGAYFIVADSYLPTESGCFTLQVSLD